MIVKLPVFVNVLKESKKAHLEAQMFLASCL